MNNDWTVGTRVFCVERGGWGSMKEEGRILTIDKATKARVSVGNRTWTRDGAPYGGERNHCSRIRSLRDGDEALDTEWRAAAKAEKEQRKNEARAWELVGVHGSTWSKLSPDKIKQIHAWLAEVKS